MANKALRILLKSSATVIAPLGDPDNGDIIPTLDELATVITAARQNPADPWVTLNTMETKVAGSEIDAFGIIDYDPNAIARAQAARMAGGNQTIGGSAPVPASQQTVEIGDSMSFNEVQTSVEAPEPTASEATEVAA